MKKIGFIGVGNMGGTLAKVARHYPGELLVSSRTLEKAEAFAKENGCFPMTNQDLAAQADYIFLGVKPQKMQELFAEISPVLTRRTDRFVLVSMAAGLTTQQIGSLCGVPCPILRIMPNTPALVGEGVIPYCGNGEVTEDECRELEAILKAAGLVTPLPESLIDAASAFSGCGPAFVCLFIEALSDGAVACGLPRKTALDFAAQTVLGSAKMVLETGLHPGVLKDNVCSPGGSTIAGVRALEESGFRAAAINAVIAAFERTKQLGKLSK